jgi:hypothetical protein
MRDQAEKRGQLIRHLEEALALADEMEDGQTGFLIERALDEARSRHVSAWPSCSAMTPIGTPRMASVEPCVCLST